MTAHDPIRHQRDGHSWLEAGGGNETIVFLHPIVGTSIFWEPQMQALADRWRCVAWDAPGYRGTTPVGPPLAESVTASLVDFLDVAGIDRAHVVGLSLGAMVALHAVGEHTERFDKIVVADTSAAFGIDPDEWLDGWLADLRSGTPLTTVVDASIGAITTRPPDADLRARIVQSFGDVPNDAFEVASRYIAGHDVRDRLASIGNDMLVLVGADDGETPPEYGREIAQTVPNATFVEMAGVGHLTSIEAPDDFTDRVRTFLAGQ